MPLPSQPARPEPKVGDAVQFFFLSQKGRALESRPAVLTKIWPVELDEDGKVTGDPWPVADLIVEFDATDIAAGFAPTQTHQRMAVSGVAKSGTWRWSPQQQPDGAGG